MPLEPTRLSTAIRSALLNDPTSYAEDNEALTALCNAIAQAVVAEIVANGMVLPGTFTVATPGGPVPVLGVGVIT